MEPFFSIILFFSTIGGLFDGAPETPSQVATSEDNNRTVAQEKLNKQKDTQATSSRDTKTVSQDEATTTESTVSKKEKKTKDQVQEDTRESNGEVAGTRTNNSSESVDNVDEQVSTSTNSPEEYSTSTLEADAAGEAESDEESSHQEQQTNTEYHEVVEVVDGDTVTVQIDGREEDVRLIGIDTPETVHPNKPQECFGKEASQKAKDLLSGEQVRLESDASQANRGDYGRLLRYVYLPGGRHFNKLMIKQGYAYEYTYNIPYKYQDEFKQAEKKARENERGLWASDTCDGELEEDTQESDSSGEAEDSTTDSADGDCSMNKYNCSDFDTHEAAQEMYEKCGGPDRDPHLLDGDSNGVACESLKGDDTTDIDNDTETEEDTNEQSEPQKSRCGSNVYNCSDFDTHEAAQSTYEYCGGVDNDVHRLDGDGNGVACESLQ